MEQQGINIRLAEEKDKKAILEIIALLYIDMPGFVWDSDGFVSEQIKHGEYFVLEENGEVLAILSLRKRKNKVSIETLAVKKEHQKRGFGSALIDFAKKFTKDSGFKTLHAYSFSEYKATDFYLRRSFKVLDVAGDYHGHRYDCFVFEIE